MKLSSVMKKATAQVRIAIHQSPVLEGRRDAPNMGLLGRGSRDRLVLLGPHTRQKRAMRLKRQRVAGDMRELSVLEEIEKGWEGAKIRVIKVALLTAIRPKDVGAGIFERGSNSENGFS